MQGNKLPIIWYNIFMTVKQQERPEINVHCVNIAGRGWGESNAVPDEEAIVVLSRLGEVESLEPGHDRWRVTLNPTFRTIGNLSGGHDIKAGDINIGDVAKLGTTWIDLEKLDQIKG